MGRFKPNEMLIIETGVFILCFLNSSVLIIIIIVIPGPLMKILYLALIDPDY